MSSADPIIARCYACAGPSRVALPRYEHDGRISHFHPTCVGGWLMGNPDTVINFYTGTDQPDPKDVDVEERR